MTDPDKAPQAETLSEEQLEAVVGGVGAAEAVGLGEAAMLGEAG